MKIALVLSFLISALLAAPSADELIHPSIVRECLEKPAIKGQLKVMTDVNPYYLRGDFDGDGLVDYAVSVQGIKTRRNGVLVCTGKNKTFVLGAINSLHTPFSDKPNDNFAAPNWQVMTKKEALQIYNYDGDKPVRVIRVALSKAEVIAMTWEDGTCLIYWDGSRYRWGCGQ